MKKVLLTAVICIACATTMMAQSASSIRQGVINYLREEGFNPTMNDDGQTINFKREGAMYGVSIIGDEAPYTVYIYRAGLDLSNYDRTRMIKACNRANREKRAAKAQVGTSSVIFSSELYCDSLSELRNVLLLSARCANNMRETVIKYYNENSF